MNYIKIIDHILEVIEKTLVVFLFSCLVIMIVFNIISRNVFKTSFQEILEICPQIVLWLALIGASLALKESRHIKIEFFLRFTSAKFRFFADKVTSVFGMVIMGLLFYASVKFIENEISIFGFKGVLSIIFPWFFGVSFFRFFANLLYRSDIITTRA
jgi:TRAP-type C4-dicarboxylate transport system permease small subunit